MSYSIIPPVLVLLSLAGIIVFLLKKSRKVAQFSFVDEKEKSLGSKGRSFFSSRRNSSENSTGTFKQTWLAFLEKLARRSRLVVLKIENVFSTWSESLKERRKKNIQEFPVKNKEEIYSENSRESSVEEKLEEDSLRKNNRREIFFRKRSSEEEPRAVNQKEETNKEIVAVPSRGATEKSQLEDALIERIASNPKDTEAYERLGEYYFEIGNYDHAKECYKQVMKLSPGNIRVRSRMRKLERMLGR